MNFRFPVFLDVSKKNCLVTGEGYEIPAKVHALAEASANVLYVNPNADERIAQMAAAGLIRWEKRAFEPHDLDNCFLAIADTENNAQIFALAEKKQVLCNCVDDPGNCRFSFGSIHRRGELTIAVSTNGWAPAVAVRLRQWLEHQIGPEYTVLLELLKDIRPTITSGIEDFATRRELWYRIVDSRALEMLRSGRREEAEAVIHKLVHEALNNT